MSKPITRLFLNPTALNHGPGTAQYEGLPLTPNDTDNLPTRGAAGLVAAGAGTVAAQTPSGATVVITIGAGAVSVPVVIDVTRILATGTTATGIYALYRKVL